MQAPQQLFSITFRPRDFCVANKLRFLNFLEKFKYTKKFWYVLENSENPGEDPPNHMHVFLYTHPCQRSYLRLAIKRKVFDNNLPADQYAAFLGTGLHKGLKVAEDWYWYDTYMQKDFKDPDATPIGPDMTDALRAELTPLFPAPNSLKRIFEDHWYGPMTKRLRARYPYITSITYDQALSFMEYSMFVDHSIRVLRDQRTINNRARLFVKYFNANDSTAVWFKSTGALPEEMGGPFLGDL